MRVPRDREGNGSSAVEGKVFWLRDNLPNSILPNAILPDAILPNLPFYPMPFYPIPTYPMLFDLFVQLSDNKLAVAIRRMI